MSKELNNILEAIDNYCKKHKGKVQFIGSFIAFQGKDFKVVDDRIIAYGVKESLLIDLDELQKQIKEDKEEFINW